MAWGVKLPGDARTLTASPTLKARIHNSVEKMKAVPTRTGTANLDFLSPSLALPRERQLFIDRFNEALSGWGQYDRDLARFVKDDLGVDPDLKHVRYIHRDKRIVMDRVHVDDDTRPFQGIISAFHIVNHNGDLHEFVHTFETRLADPGDWPGRLRDVQSSAHDVGLRFHPQCNRLVPVFYTASPTPRISDLEDFALRLRKFADRFQMQYDPDAARRSIPHDSRYDE